MVHEYFEDIFSHSVSDYDPILSTVSPRISAKVNNALLALFSIGEFRKATFQMHPNKSPGPDGFNLILCFFKSVRDLLVMTFLHLFELVE